MNVLAFNPIGSISVDQVIKVMGWLILLAPLILYLGPRLLAYIRSRLTGWSEMRIMPRELQLATLFLNEQEIACEFPVPYHGTVDQVFKTWRGRLIIVDTKSRPRFEYYRSDVYQMSVYRFILARQFGKKVSMYGYVRVSQGEYDPLISYIQVRLLSDEAMIHLWEEYNAIRNGVYKPDCTCEGLFHS